MAKRKRLAPAALSPDVQFPSDLETKSMRPAPPISGIVQDAASTAALEEMSQVLRSAREDGRMVLDLPLEQIELDYLVRDRLASEPQEMEALVSSLRTRGQQQPIEVASLGTDRYGLISGWRRCQALATLAQSTGKPAHVLALVRAPKEQSDAYVSMVEENEIRVGLSYYERARIVLRAVEEGVFDSDKSALQSLFQTASRSKRSKIGSFLHIVRALDCVLRFPTAIAERAGLALARNLEDDPEFGRHLSAHLRAAAPTTAEAERRSLEEVGAFRVEPPALAPAPKLQAAEARAAPPLKPRAQQQPAVVHEPRRVASDLWVQDNKDGSITLSGSGLTKERRDRILKWIATKL